MAVLSFEEYKKQVQEGKKPESLYVSDRAINREAGAENVPAETVPVESPQKTGIKTWTRRRATRTSRLLLRRVLPGRSLSCFCFDYECIHFQGSNPF